MRATIVLWSMASGAILGLFVDATLIGVAMLAGAVAPGIAARLHQRWFTLASAVVLAAIPVALTVLGFLEGQLKTR